MLGQLLIRGSLVQAHPEAQKPREISAFAFYYFLLPSNALCKFFVSLSSQKIFRILFCHTLVMSDG